jgi:hypothetical protein
MNSQILLKKNTPNLVNSKQVENYHKVLRSTEFIVECCLECNVLNRQMFRKGLQELHTHTLCRLLYAQARET